MSNLPQGESRSYIVGLPVLVTVWDDGTVVYDIDTSETDSAVIDSWYEDGSVEGPPYKQMVDDVEAIQRDHVRRMEEGQ